MSRLTSVGQLPAVSMPGRPVASEPRQVELDFLDLPTTSGRRISSNTISTARRVRRFWGGLFQQDRRITHSTRDLHQGRQELGIAELRMRPILASEVRFEGAAPPARPPVVTN